MSLTGTTDTNSGVRMIDISHYNELMGMTVRDELVLRELKENETSSLKTYFNTKK